MAIHWNLLLQDCAALPRNRLNVQRSTSNVERSKLDVERWTFSGGFRGSMREVSLRRILTGLGFLGFLNPGRRSFYSLALGYPVAGFQPSLAASQIRHHIEQFLLRQDAIQ